MGLPCILVFVLWILAAVSLPGGITVATYNVANYNESNRMTEQGYREGYPKPESEKAALRRVLTALNADIVVFQEMGSEAHLEELRRDLIAHGLNYPHAAWMKGSDPDRHLAALSRLPFAHIHPHENLVYSLAGEKHRVRRGLLELAIETNRGTVLIFVVHLKSQLSDDADDPASANQRAGEAEAVRNRILQRVKTAATERYLIAGDCNDGPKSRAVRALSLKGKQRISTPLALVDDRGHTWTHHFRREGTYSTVDYIFVSPALQRLVESAKSWIYFHPDAERASDHRPLLVSLDVNPSRSNQ